MNDVQIPALLNDPNIPDITQCERTERTFFRSRLQNRKTKCSGWKESGKISIPRHLADFSGLVASYELYHPKAQRSKAGCSSAGSLSKHAMVRSRLLVSCLSPAVCHQAPVISPHSFFTVTQHFDSPSPLYTPPILSFWEVKQNTKRLVLTLPDTRMCSSSKIYITCFFLLCSSCCQNMLVFVSSSISKSLTFYINCQIATWHVCKHVCTASKCKIIH